MLCCLSANLCVVPGCTCKCLFRRCGCVLLSPYDVSSVQGSCLYALCGIQHITQPNNLPLNRPCAYVLHRPWVHDVVPVDMDQIGDATGSELVLVHRQQKFTAMTSFDHDATVGVVDVVDINVHVSEVLTNAGPLVSPVELLSARNALEVASLGPRPSTTMSSTSSVSKGSDVYTCVCVCACVCDGYRYACIDVRVCSYTWVVRINVRVVPYS